MTPKLSEEQRQAIQNRDSGPVEVEEQLRAELQVGFDQADAGDVGEWSVEEMLQEAHLRHSPESTP